MGFAVSASTDVAIVGMAGRFPGARSVDEFWANLRDGIESVSRFSDEELRAAGVSEALLQNPNYVRSGAPLQDMEWFDAGFFGFSPREAAILDPQHRHFLECAWEALEHAGHAPASFPGLIGLFAGSGHNAYLPYNLLTNPDLVRSVGLFLLRHTGNDKDFLATRVSYLLDLRGPSLNIQTACSTSLVAVHLACQSLLNRECDLALAGGVTIELPHRQGYLYEEGEILSPDGHCRAFDAASAGTIFGSGAGAVVLRRLSDAVADGDTIYAVVKGSAVNNDGSDKVGYLAPSVGGQARAIAEALAVGGVDPASISYVETHGTGTPVGDPIEIAALTQAFRQGTDRVGFCGIGSVKTNVGHLDTAAGVASLIKVIQSLRHDEIPASLNFEAPNPALALERSPFRVVSKRTPWRSEGGPRRAGVSSLGVGGTNAHVVVEEAPPAATSPAARAWQLLPFSARSAPALDASARNLAEYFERSPQEALADVAWTLQAGRTAHPLRRYVVARSAAEAAAGLGQPEKAAAPLVERDRPIAFLFAGGGAQHVGMGRELHRDEPAYREAVDECLALTDPGLVADLRRLLLEAEPGDSSAAGQMERPSLGLPALFITQYANARLWTTWGIKPDAMIGHSMGEYSAALLAGVFELRDALALVELRGRLFERLPPGAMLSVSLGEDQLRPFLGGELSVAAANAPELSVASGPRPAIDALERELTAREVDCARIRIGVAAHSTMLEPILGEFAAFLKRTPLKPPTAPFVSNVSGTWVTAAEATDPLYWVRHLRQTVRFAEGVGELLANPRQACLEIGPGRTLTTLARLHPRRLPSHVLATSLRHPGESEPDMAMMLSSLGRLWQSGVEIDWRLVQGAGRRRVALPTYPFQRERYWIEPGKAREAPPEEPAGRQADLASWFWEPEWVRSPLQTAPPRPEAVALLLGERGAILDRLADRLERAGCRAVVAVPATDCAEEAPGRWTVDPTSAADLETVLKSLVERGQPPTLVLHLLTLTRTPASPEQALDRSVFSAMGLGRAIGSLDLASPLRVLAIGHGLFDVAGEGVDDGYKATVAGPIRVLPREVPTVTSGVIDVRLPPAGSPAEADLIDRIVAELGAPSDDETVALRGGDRWVERYVARPRRPADRSTLASPEPRTVPDHRRPGWPWPDGGAPPGERPRGAPRAGRTVRSPSP